MGSCTCCAGVLWAIFGVEWLGGMVLYVLAVASEDVAGLVADNASMSTLT